MINNLETILRVLPRNISIVVNPDKIEEIRIRAQRPIILKNIDEEIITDYIPSQRDVLGALQIFCENSIYTYQSQICSGFITLQGGHRVGITGNFAMKDKQINNINYVSSLNIRIAKEIIGVSDAILPEIIENGNVNNTLIVSPPGSGKTTLLRDLIRNISNSGYTVSVIDERGEIAAMYKGIPQNDLGIRTDVMENVTKNLGMKIAVRTMAPQVICADEIGTEEDVDAINYGVCSGVKGIFTAHGGDINELKMNKNLSKLYEEKVFKKIIFLEKRGIMKKLYTLDKNVYKSGDEILS